MPRDSNGNYTLPLPDVQANTTIDPNWANTTLNDIKIALTGSLARNGDGGMTASFECAPGTVNAPGLSWTSETSTGLWWSSAGDMRATVQGINKQRWTAAGSELWNGTAWSPVQTLLTSNALYLPLAGGAMTGGILLPDGVLPTPVLRFSSDANVGIYKSSDTDGLGLAANVLNFGSSAADTNMDFNYYNGSQAKVWTIRRRSTANLNVLEIFRTVGGVPQNPSISFGYPITGDPGSCQFPQAPTVGGSALLTSALGAELAINETITGTWTFTSANTRFKSASGGTALQLQSNAGFAGEINMYTFGGVTDDRRWVIQNSGSSAFQIIRLTGTGSGTLVDIPIAIPSATGIINFALTPTVAGTSLLTTTAAAAVYEPVITPKLTAFNQDYGTTLNTVAQGNHLHTGVYVPVANIAYGEQITATVTLSAAGPVGNLLPVITSSTGITYSSTAIIVSIAGVYRVGFSTIVTPITAVGSLAIVLVKTPAAFTSSPIGFYKGTSTMVGVLSLQGIVSLAAGDVLTPTVTGFTAGDSWSIAATRFNVQRIA